MTAHIRSKIAILLVALTLPACQAPFARKTAPIFTRMAPPKKVEPARPEQHDTPPPKAIIDNATRRNELESRLSEVESRLAGWKPAPQFTTRRVRTFRPGSGSLSVARSSVQITLKRNACLSRMRPRRRMTSARACPSSMQT